MITRTTLKKYLDYQDLLIKHNITANYFRNILGRMGGDQHTIMCKKCNIKFTSTDEQLIINDVAQHPRKTHGLWLYIKNEYDSPGKHT